MSSLLIPLAENLIASAIDQKVEDTNARSSNASQNSILHRLLSFLDNKIEKLDVEIKREYIAITQSLVNTAQPPTPLKSIIHAPSYHTPPTTRKDVISNITRKYVAHLERMLLKTR